MAYHFADELTQDVIVRLLQGSFRGADPKRDVFEICLRRCRNMTKKHGPNRDYDVEQVEHAADTGSPCGTISQSEPMLT